MITKADKVTFLFVVLVCTVAVLALMMQGCVGSYTATDAEKYNYIVLNSTFDYLRVGESRTYYAKTNPSSANYILKWESSDENVATVSHEGEVTAVGSGNAVISVTCADPVAKASCKVTVYDELADEMIQGTNALQEAADRVKNCGYVFVKSGLYEAVTIDKCVNIIAEDGAMTKGVVLEENADLYVTGLGFYASESLNGIPHVSIGKQSGFTALNCSFFVDNTEEKQEDGAICAVMCEDGCEKIYLRGCVFDGYKECVNIVAGEADVYIVNNNFRNAETAVNIDIRKAGTSENTDAKGKVTDNIYIKCASCAKLLFNGGSYTGKLDFPETGVRVPV